MLPLHHPAWWISKRTEVMCMSNILVPNLLNLWDGLPHLAVLMFPFRAVTKQSTLPCWKKNALCVVPSRCIRVTCCPFLVIRKLLRSAISIRTGRYRLCPSLLPNKNNYDYHHLELTPYAGSSFNKWLLFSWSRKTMLLRNPKGHIHKILPMHHILSQLNPVCTLIPYFS